MHSEGMTFLPLNGQTAVQAVRLLVYNEIRRTYL